MHTKLPSRQRVNAYVIKKKSPRPVCMYSFSEVIDPAIRKVLSFRGEQTTATLAPQDIFFREVSVFNLICSCISVF